MAGEGLRGRGSRYQVMAAVAARLRPLAAGSPMQAASAALLHRKVFVDEIAALVPLALFALLALASARGVGRVGYAAEAKRWSALRRCSYSRSPWPWIAPAKATLPTRGSPCVWERGEDPASSGVFRRRQQKPACLCITVLPVCAAAGLLTCPCRLCLSCPPVTAPDGSISPPPMSDSDRRPPLLPLRPTRTTGCRDVNRAH